MIRSILQNDLLGQESSSNNITKLLAGVFERQLRKRHRLPIRILERARLGILGPLPGGVGVLPSLRVSDQLAFTRSACGQEGQNVVDVGALRKVGGEPESWRVVFRRPDEVGGGRLGMIELRVEVERAQQGGICAGHVHDLGRRGVLGEVFWVRHDGFMIF
jgi:hypothetical protein